jgi:signal transduction histidine kinase
MSAALGLAGWLLAAASLAAAAIVGTRLARHSEAVAWACHELRGPLTCVRLGIELGVRVRQLPHTRLRAIELELGRAALALDDLSAARHGRRRATSSLWPAATHLGPVDVAELAGDSVEAWRAAATARGGRLRLVRPRHPLLVDGERLRLAQAIGNLIANAIEHGGAVVEVILRSDRGLVRVEVVDEGPGLRAPIEQLGRRRGRRWRRRGRLEHGHGLAIASAVATAHGGRLAAQPRDRGARLVLELPGAEERRRRVNRG